MFENGRWPKNKFNHKQFKVKLIIFLKMEDDLNFWGKGRRPQFFWKWIQPQKNNVIKTFESKNDGCGTATGNLVHNIKS